MTSFLVPLVSLFIYVLGSHSANIFVSVALELSSYSATAIGFMNSIGYIGLLAAGYNADILIAREGHSKTFIYTAFLLSFLSILFYVTHHYFLWCLYRFVFGYIVGIMYVVIESWMLLLPPVSKRIFRLSCYMLVLYLSQSLSGFIVQIQPNSYTPFLISSIFLILSIFPMIFSKKIHKNINEEQIQIMNFRDIYHISKIGFWGSLLSGIVTGSYVSLFPSIAIRSTISVGMTMFILHGAGGLAQWPIGVIAQKYGNKKILTLLSLGIGLVSCLVLLDKLNYVTIGLLGTFSFTLYPLSIALACDGMKTQEIVSASKILLVAYSIGSIIAPPIIGLSIDYFNNNFLLFSITGFFAGAYFLILLINKDKIYKKQNLKFKRKKL